jgi:cysteinyl-tRNA synthetase
MPLRLYNTLTRQVEAFEPLQPGKVSLYTCGPTVYNYAHIGNFRTFLFEDLLRRWLEASGYEVFQIMNLTDVDDRTINAARDKGVSLGDHVQHFIEAFHEDRRDQGRLGLSSSHRLHRADDRARPSAAEEGNRL